MLRGLRYIAARPDGRMRDLDSTVRWNTVASLIDRGLLEIVVADGTCKFYAITPAGRAAAGVDEPITDGLFAQADEVTPEPAPTQDTLTADQADGLACVACGVDFLRSPVASVPVGASHVGQVFACVGCAIVANGGEADNDDTVEGDDVQPNAYGENAMPGWPVVDIVRWAVDDLLTNGELPFTGNPIPTATVPRTYATGRDGDLIGAPFRHPADPDTSPFWRKVPRVVLPPLR